MELSDFVPASQLPPRESVTDTRSRRLSATKRWLLLVGLAATVAVVVSLAWMVANRADEKFGEIVTAAKSEHLGFRNPDPRTSTRVPYTHKNGSLECTSPLLLGRPDNRSFINLGQATEDMEYPWVAEIVVITSRGRAFCGGTILDTRHILSAGHCFLAVSDLDNETESFIMDPSLVVVYVGARRFLDDFWFFERSGLATQVTVETIYIHPAFIRTGNGMTDLAVLRLDTALKLSDHVLPVCIAGEDDNPPDVCIAVGWGWSAKSHTVSLTLQQVYQRSYSKEDCVKIFREEVGLQNYDGDLNADLAGTICTRSDDEYPGSPCQGDSGGPLLCEPRDSSSTALKQFGITSYSLHEDCGTPRRVVAYVNVALWRFWLQDFAVPLLAGELDFDNTSTLIDNATGAAEDRVPDGADSPEASRRSGSMGSARRELGELTAGCQRVPSTQRLVLQGSLTLRDARHVCPVVASVALCWKRRRPQPWQDCLALLPVQTRTADVAMRVRELACHPFVLNCKP